MELRTYLISTQPCVRCTSGGRLSRELMLARVDIASDLRGDSNFAWRSRVACLLRGGFRGWSRGRRSRPVGRKVANMDVGFVGSGGISLGAKRSELFSRVKCSRARRNVQRVAAPPARAFSRSKVVATVETEEAAGGGRGALQIMQDQDDLINFFMMDDNNIRRELTLKEKEYLFLDALYAYGSAEEEPVLTDEQFDLLKEDLTWEGSRVMLLNEQEKKFLEAARSYHKGKPIMSDDEFDEMREELRMAGSAIAVSRGPKCSLETMVCATECRLDTERMFVTQLPAAGIGALVWAVITFEVPPLREIPHIYSLIAGVPFIALFAKFATGLVLPSPSKIVLGDCPNCGAEIRTYFGDVATVDGNIEKADLKCPDCKTKVSVLADEMKIEISVQNKK